MLQEKTRFWLPPEKLMIDQCINELLNGSSVIIQAYTGVNSELFCELIVKKLWDTGYSDNAYYIPWPYLGDLPPATVIGQALYTTEGQLRKAENLLELNIDIEKPVIVLLSGVQNSNGQKWNDLLSIWADYLYQFKPYNEMGQGICVFIDSEVNGLGRQYAVQALPFVSCEPEESIIGTYTTI